MTVPKCLVLKSTENKPSSTFIRHISKNICINMNLKKYYHKVIIHTHTHTQCHTHTHTITTTINAQEESQQTLLFLMKIKRLPPSVIHSFYRHHLWTDIVVFTSSLKTLAMWPQLLQATGALLVQSTQDWLIEQNIESDITLDIDNVRLGRKATADTDSQPASVQNSPSSYHILK